MCIASIDAQLSPLATLGSVGAGARGQDIDVSRVARGRARAPGVLALEAPVERIVVFRARMLGDMLCAVPVLRALRHGYPDAEISLVCLPPMRALARRLDCVDRCIDFPGWPGLPEMAPDVRALPDFLAQLQARRYDLALQLHGSDSVSNSLVASFGARHTAGFAGPAAWRPEADAVWYAPWPERGHEIDRLLTLTDHLGLERQGRQLDFPLHDEDHAELAAAWPDAHSGKPYVCVHAGAQLPSRRWPIERFAAVADRLAESGRTVVLIGGAPEAPLVGRLAAQMRQPAVNLVGRTSLGSLGALVAGAERVVCNDTGISQIAAALQVPSVVVSCGADVSRWAPQDHALHTVLWQPMECRPCAQAVCPVGHGCTEGVSVDAVLRALGLDDGVAAMAIARPAARRLAAS